MELKSQRRSNKKFFIIVGIILICIALTYLISAVSHASINAAYKSQFSSFQGIATNYQNIYSDYFSAPTTITRTKSDWDTYYNDITQRVQIVRNSLSAISYSDKRLDAVNKDLGISINDFTEYLSLAKSNIDLQFQVSEDKNKIQSDNQLIQMDSDLPDIYNQSNRTQLAADQTTLKNDQSTYDDQTKQLNNLLSTTTSDYDRAQGDLAFAAQHQ